MREKKCCLLLRCSLQERVEKCVQKVLPTFKRQPAGAQLKECMQKSVAYFAAAAEKNRLQLQL